MQAPPLHPQRKPSWRARLWTPLPTAQLPLGTRFLNAALVGVFLLALAIGLLAASPLHWDWSLVSSYYSLFLRGWLHTLAISSGALLLSTLLGIILAWAQSASFLPLRFLAKTYVQIIRGTPFLAQIYVFFYLVADALHFENRYASGILILSFFSAAYLAEIIRAGLHSIAASQQESALALGFTPFQMFRYVVFPQAIRTMLPPLSGQFVSLIKDSSLLSIIGLEELTQNAKNVASFTFSNFESYLLLALGYLALTLPIALWTRWLEKRVAFDA